MPQLQAVNTGAELPDRSDLGHVKLLAVSLLNKAADFLAGVIGQELGQDDLGHLAIVHFGHFLDLRKVEGGQGHRSEQAAVFRQALQNSMGGSDPQVTISGTAKFHGNTS